MVSLDVGCGHSPKGGVNIVLALITMNSYSKMKKAPVSFVKVLNSTLQIPYKHIILVDDSTDETRGVFKDWCLKHQKEFIVRGSSLFGYFKPTRATARQTAIDIFLNNFREDWLLFIDDDVIINNGWWEEAKEFINKLNIGLVWGINFDSLAVRREYLKVLNIDYVKFLIDEFYRRGGMHDTLLRREAIRSIRIPPDLHVFEDWYILKHVQKQKYEVGIIKAGVVHYNPEWNYSKKSIREMACLSKKYGLEPTDLKYGIYRLLRSLLSIVPTSHVSIRAFGLEKGLKRAFFRWRFKVLYRAFFLFSKYSP